MLKDGALRKKLQEIGIPNWGSKDLMKRRHIEWLNIHNSNCDADDSVRKSKRQLLHELEEWENTQGGRAHSKDDRVMRKDFDGNGHARSHKSDFDDLIARARQKRAAPKPDAEVKTNQEDNNTKQARPIPDSEVEGNQGFDDAGHQYRPQDYANTTLNHGSESHYGAEPHSQSDRHQGLDAGALARPNNARQVHEPGSVESRSGMQDADDQSNMVPLNPDTSYGIPDSQKGHSHMLPILSTPAEEQYTIDVDSSTTVQ
jgi:hypothetical protein